MMNKSQIDLLYIDQSLSCEGKEHQAAKECGVIFSANNIV